MEDIMPGFLWADYSLKSKKFKHHINYCHRWFVHFFCYNIIASRGSTTFTYLFVLKHQSRWNYETEPSITYWKRITNYFSADFSDNWYQTLIPKQYQTGWEHREYREKRSKTREISRKLAQNKAKSNCGKELVSEWEWVLHSKTQLWLPSASYEFRYTSCSYELSDDNV